MTARPSENPPTVDQIRAINDPTALHHAIEALVSANERSILRTLAVDGVTGTLTPVASAARGALLRTTGESGPWSIEDLGKPELWSTL